MAMVISARIGLIVDARRLNTGTNTASELARLWSQLLQSVHCMVSLPHALSHTRQGNRTWRGIVDIVSETRLIPHDEQLITDTASTQMRRRLVRHVQ